MTTENPTTQKKSLMDRFLNMVEVDRKSVV